MRKTLMIAALMAAAGTSHAGLLGQNIAAQEIDTYASQLGAPPFNQTSFTVSDAVELTGYGFAKEATIDFFDNKIVIAFNDANGASFNKYGVVYQFKLTSPDASFTSALVAPSTSSFTAQPVLGQTVPRASGPSIYFTANTLSVSLRDLVATSGSKIELQVAVSNVPEPNTAWLYASGLIGLLAARRAVNGQAKVKAKPAV